MVSIRVILLVWRQTMATFGRKIIFLGTIIFLMACSKEYKDAIRPQIEDTPILVLAAQNQHSFSGIAIEAGGKTALVTWENYPMISRANLETGDLTIITNRRESGYNGVFSGIAIESGGLTILATTVSGELVRVNLTTGDFIVIATGFNFNTESLGVLAVEGGGQMALVVELCQFTRVNLSDGTKMSIVGFDPCRYGYAQGVGGGVVIEPSGQTALVLQGGVLWRVNLLTGEKRLISDFHPISAPKWGLALEPSGTTAIVTYHSLGGPFVELGLLRVDLATGQVGTISRGLGWLRGVVVEEGGKTALAAGFNGIVRVKLVP